MIMIVIVIIIMIMIIIIIMTMVMITIVITTRILIWVAPNLSFFLLIFFFFFLFLFLFFFFNRDFYHKDSLDLGCFCHCTVRRLLNPRYIGLQEVQDVDLGLFGDMEALREELPTYVRRGSRRSQPGNDTGLVEHPWEQDSLMEKGSSQSVCHFPNICRS